MMISRSPHRRPFESLPKHTLSADPFDDPFAEQPARPDAALIARARLFKRCWSPGGIAHRAFDTLRPNAIIALITFLFVAVAFLAVWSLFTPAPRPDPRGMAGVEAARVPIVTPAPVPSVTALATAMPTFVPTVTPIITPTVNLPKWLTSTCIHNIEIIGAGEFSEITDTLTLEVGMTQIVNTAIQSQCGDTAVKGSLFNVWNGWKKFSNSGTAPVIDMYITRATDLALQNWQLPQYPIYSLFGSRADLHTWYHGDWYQNCDVVQGYPLIAPRVFGLICIEGK